MEKKITVVGLGNILMQDEGAGVHAVRALEAGFELPPELVVLDGGTIGLDLLAYIENQDRAMFVDAVNFGKEPGYIGVLENQEIPALFATKDSLHHLGLMDVLAAAQLLEVTPRETCLIGIQPSSLETGLELSPLLRGKMGLLLEQIIAKLKAWGLTVTPRPDSRQL